MIVVLSVYSTWKFWCDDHEYHCQYLPPVLAGHLCSSILALNYLPSVVTGFSGCQMYFHDFIESDWQVCGTHYNVSLSNSFKLLWDAFGRCVYVRGASLDRFSWLLPWYSLYSLRSLSNLSSIDSFGSIRSGLGECDWRPEPEIATPTPSSDTPDSCKLATSSAASAVSNS